MTSILHKISWIGYEYNKQADRYNLLALDVALLLCCLVA